MQEVTHSCLLEAVRGAGWWRWRGRQFKTLKNHLLVFPIRKWKRSRSNDFFFHSVLDTTTLSPPLLLSLFLWLHFSLTERWGHSCSSPWALCWWVLVRGLDVVASGWLDLERLLNLKRATNQTKNLVTVKWAHHLSHIANLQRTPTSEDSSVSSLRLWLNREQGLVWASAEDKGSEVQLRTTERLGTKTKIFNCENYPQFFFFQTFLLALGIKVMWNCELFFFQYFLWCTCVLSFHAFLIWDSVTSSSFYRLWNEMKGRINWHKPVVLGENWFGHKPKKVKSNCTVPQGLTVSSQTALHIKPCEFSSILEEAIKLLHCLL